VLYLNELFYDAAPPKPVVPKINFGGRIVYSRTWSEVEKATLELLQIVESKKSNMTGRVPLGFDLEWRPFFNRGEIGYLKQSTWDNNFFISLIIPLFFLFFFIFDKIFHISINIQKMSMHFTKKGSQDSRFKLHRFHSKPAMEGQQS
jgi:hypothetical protein